MEKDIREHIRENLVEADNFCIIVHVNQDLPTHGKIVKICKTEKELDSYIDAWNDKVKNGEEPVDFQPQLILAEHAPIGLIAPKTYNIKTDSLMSEKGKIKIREVMSDIMSKRFTDNIDTSNNP